MNKLIQNKSIVPLKIDNKFVKFLLLEFNGKEVLKEGKYRKVIQLDKFSKLAKFLRINCVKANHKINYSEYNIFILLNSDKVRCSVYQQESGIRTELQLPKEIVKDFNGLIEDYFFNNFISYVRGSVDSNLENISEFSDKNEGLTKSDIKAKTIKSAIKRFITKYELDEHYADAYTAFERRYFRSVGEPIFKKMVSSR